MSDRADQLAPNLWRWTTPHPRWRPGDDERAGGWERDVGSVVYARDGTVTIIDPLAGENEAALWGVPRRAHRGRRSRRRRPHGVVAPAQRPAVAGHHDADIRVHRIAAGDATRSPARPPWRFAGSG